MAVRLEDEIQSELGQVSWKVILDYALRSLPLLGAALPATLIVAGSYSSGYADYFHIPDEFVRVSPQEAIAPFTWASIIVILLLRFAHQVQMFGPWPAIRINLTRFRGIAFLLLVLFVAVEVRGHRLSRSEAVSGLVGIWLLFGEFRSYYDWASGWRGGLLVETEELGTLSGGPLVRR